MKIEDEIKQGKAFESSIQKALINVIYTGNFFQDKSAKTLKIFDINDQHYNILRILKGKNPASACPGEIKEVLLNKRGDLTRLLDKLVKKGYVSRQQNEENRRMVLLNLTEEGESFLAQVSEEMQEWRSLGQNLTEEEAEQLSFLLDKLRT